MCTHAQAHICIHPHRMFGWNEYVLERWQYVVSPGQDLLSYAHTLSCSVCLSAYLLTKELSLCLSGRIVLNGDFLCNHLIIHQFPKKPQRGCVSTLCWRALQWDRKGRGRASWRKWSKWILASLPMTSICIYFAFIFAHLCIPEMWGYSRFLLIFFNLFYLLRTGLLAKL